MQNFGKIRHTFNNLLVESITNNDSANKLLFKEYIKCVKKSKVLKTQFNVYYNLEHKHETDTFKSSEYIKENISLIQKFDTKTIIEENNKLISILKKHGLKVIDEEYANSDLHENITNLIFTKKTSKTIDVLMESLNHVMGYVKDNIILVEERKEIFPSSILGGIMVEKFNEKYSSLSEETQKIIKVVLNSNEENKVDMLDSLKNECVDLLNIKLEETDDVEHKGKLLDVKGAILNMKYVSENFISDISRIIELKEDLTNE